MKSLTAKFILFIILPVTLIMSALSLTSYFMARNLLLDQMKTSGQNFLRASADEISSRIIQVQSTLKLMAVSESLETLDDSERRGMFLALKDLLGGAVTSVFMGFADGKFIRTKTTLLPKDYDPRKDPGTLTHCGCRQVFSMELQSRIWTPAPNIRPSPYFIKL